MEPKIIRSEELKENDFGATKTADIINSEEWSFFSVARVRKTGDDVKLGYDSESNTVYYVLEGEGDCEIDGQTYHLKKGDCVVYPQGTKYKHLKGITLLAISSPRFDRSKRVYIDEK